jgi:hypothetical protein
MTGVFEVVLVRLNGVSRLQGARALERPLHFYVETFSLHTPKGHCYM